VDLFYKNEVASGTLMVVKVQKVYGQASIVAFTDPSPAGSEGTFVENATIQRLTYTQQSNAQFQQSLDNVLYVYSFGDHIGDLQITGLAFPRACGNDRNGIQEVINFYKDYRISRSVSPVKISFVDEIIRGYLLGMSIATVDTSSGVHSYNMKLKTIPAAMDRTPPGVSWAGLGTEEITGGAAVA